MTALERRYKLNIKEGSFADLTWLQADRKIQALLDVGLTLWYLEPEEDDP